MLVWLGVVLKLFSQLPVDGVVLSTPNACKRDQVMRSRGLRIEGYDVMGLRTCSRRSQSMAFAIRGDYRWWIFGWQPVASAGDDVVPAVRLVRHALVRGTLADGTPAVAQVFDVLWQDRCLACRPSVNKRRLEQTVTVCSLPRASRIHCGTVSGICMADRCPAVSLVRGALRSTRAYAVD